MKTILFLNHIIEHHHNDALPYILKDLVKVKISKEEQKDMKYVIYDNYLIIVKNNDMIYRINFYNDYYAVIKYFENYRILIRYDKNHKLINKTFITDLDNNKILGFVEETQKNFTIRRMVYTDCKDTRLMNGSYEKTYLFENNYNLSSLYTFYGHNDDNKCYKTVSTANNLYYYHSNNQVEPIDKLSDNISIEIAASISIPSTNVVGRIRNKNELLAEIIKYPCPTIKLHGLSYKYTGSEDREVDIYNLTVHKTDKELEIICDYLTEDGQIGQKSFKVKSSNQKIITSEDINILISSIISNLNFDFNLYIIEELKKLKKEILFHEQQYLKEFDTIDLELMLNPSFNEFIFKLYCNLPKYIEAINNNCSNEKIGIKLTKN